MVVGFCQVTASYIHHWSWVQSCLKSLENEISWVVCILCIGTRKSSWTCPSTVHLSGGHKEVCASNMHATGCSLLGCNYECIWSLYLNYVIGFHTICSYILPIWCKTLCSPFISVIKFQCLRFIASLNYIGRCFIMKLYLHHGYFQVTKLVLDTCSARQRLHQAYLLRHG